jgi:hypothetical protein
MVVLPRASPRASGWMCSNGSVATLAGPAGRLKERDAGNPVGNLQMAADGAGADSFAVRWYLRYSLSLRDVEELLAERGLAAAHATIWRWVQRYGSELAAATAASS